MFGAARCLAVTWSVLALITPSPLEASTQAPLCAESVQQAEKARALVVQGLENALVEHTTRLFRVWLSVGIEGRGRAAEGIRNEVRGFLYAQHAVGEWIIPVCKDGKPKAPTPGTGG